MDSGGPVGRASWAAVEVPASDRFCVQGRQAQGHHHRGLRALFVWDAATLQRTTPALLVACQPQYRRFAGLGCRSRLNGTVPTTLRLGFWKDHVAKHETQWDPPRLLQSRSVSLTRVYASSMSPRSLDFWRLSRWEKTSRIVHTCPTT